MYVIPQEQIFLQKVSEYVNGKTSLHDLHEFSLLNVNDFLDSNDQIIVELVKDLEASVVEIQEDLLSEKQLKKSFKKILAKCQPQVITLGTSAVSSQFYDFSLGITKGKQEELSTFTFDHSFA